MGCATGVNHGQGIGFKVLGLALTKKVLVIIFLEFLTDLFFPVPILRSKSDGRGNHIVNGVKNNTCTLPDSHKVAMRSTLESFNCLRAGWSNATIASHNGIQ